MSNRLTFSLASLIVLLTFGLVFGITSVEAHQTGRAHPHPLNEDLPARDLNNDGDQTDVGEEAVTAHNGHPTATITLKEVEDVARGSEAIVTATAATFTIVIDFDMDVVSANDQRTVAGDTNSATALAESEFTFLALNANGVEIDTPFTIGAPTRVAMDNSKWEAVVTVNAAAIPTGTAELATVTTRFQVNAGVVFSLQTQPDLTAVPGTGNYASPSPAAEFTLVQELEPVTVEDPEPVMFAVSGMPSLTAPFTVTFTSTSMDSDGDPVGAMLAFADIMVTGGYAVEQSLNSNSSPADAPMTVWTVIVQPYPGTEMVSVTIADDSATAPAADEDDGTLMLEEQSGMLSSITPASDADDRDAFVVTFTFAAALPDGVSLVKGDIKVTPATAMVGTPRVSLDDDKVWEVKITPTAGMDTKIELSDAGKLKFAYSGSAVTVKASSSSVPTGGTIDATRSNNVVTLDGVIAAHGFVVIDSSALPDLEAFLFVGGTIGLDDEDGTDDKNSRTVVISEILWGLDLGAAVAEETMHQFIELYNTTNAAIDLTGWTLTFTEGRAVPASDIDQVSNRSGAGWVADIGQSGRVTGTRAEHLDNTVTPIRIVSMYRNINYDKVETEAAKATVNRGELLKGVPGGNAKGSWKASTRHTTNRWIYDSKGRKHATSSAIITARTVKRTPFVINEIGNGSGDSQDWVELRNVTGSEASLKNYHLSIVTAAGTDTSLVNFKDKDYKVPGNGLIVLVNTDPSDTDLAGGVNVALGAADQENKGASHLYHVDSNLKLPDGGKFNLILRNAHDKLGADSDHFIDAVGMQNFVHQGRGTSFWPLPAAGGKHGDVNNDDRGDGHEDFRSGFVYQRDNTASNGQHTIDVRGYTGIGYDRNAAETKANGGTPGYSNGALKEKRADLSDVDSITISEIMVDTGEGRQNLAQWIELYNSSMTEAVNLNGWKLHIENAANGDGTLETNTFSATITLGTMTISPNQTVLIATTTGLISDRDHFPSTRVVNLWTTKAHRDALEMARRTDPVLSSTGFNIMLADKDNKTVDEVGNLDGNRRSRDEPAWALPTGEDDGRRSSLVRVYDEGVAVPGTMADAWVSADATNLAWAISHTYYGNPDDFGTPGFRAGGPLPVQLSKFRPERQADGSIVVRWITESELDNAGFNILRSETRDGEFTKLNAQLIEGQGTTSERNTYEFVDTTAKPNVVYYYQIQDVSLDGKVQTLRQSRLKGHVSPAGKLTTVWGELKALQ